MIQATFEISAGLHILPRPPEGLEWFEADGKTIFPVVNKEGDIVKYVAYLTFDGEQLIEFIKETKPELVREGSYMVRCPWCDGAMHYIHNLTNSFVGFDRKKED